jgi:ABC-2 type transport system permease protein
MRSFVQLYKATVREFARDKSALFWTFAFPIFFIVIFGVIFSGDQNISFKIGLVNEDGAASTRLVQGFKQISAFKIDEGTRDAELKALKDGDRSAVIIIPAGTGAALAANPTLLTGANQGAASGQATLNVYYDPANQNTSQIVLNIIDKVVAGMNEGITGVQPVLTIQSQSVTTSSLSSIDYLLPGVLAMSLMQLGLFATAAPLVSLREKGVLRRMGATPLSKTTLLTSQVAFRLTTAFAQTALIVLVGVGVFHVHIVASHIIGIVAMVLLGASLFITMGYFLSGVAKTEEAVNGLIQLPNITFMFLSGIFFPVDIMPSWIRPLVDVIPLTYVGDALRKTMINAGSYFSMTRNVAIMLAWLVVCGVLALKFFRWETEM